MCTTLKIQQTAADYVPTCLKHDATGWYLTYYVFNPSITKMERKKVKLNLLRRRCRTLLEFKLQVNDIMRTIDNQLRINAFAMTQQLTNLQPQPAAVVVNTAQSTVQLTKAETSENSRYFLQLEEVTHIYIKQKSKELRETTMRSYRSFCSMLRDWVAINYPTLKISQFTRAHAIEFLDAMSEKDLRASTYNNLIKLGTVFFKWAKEKCYIRENPFEGQKRRRTQEKKRTIIKPEHQVQIDNWFAENKPEMRIVCRMVYTSLLRPVEITRVQVKQLDFRNHCIVMPGEKTKTWDDREGRMDTELESMLRAHIHGASPEDYVFSNNLQCGDSPISPKNFSKLWDRMRTALKMPAEYQLYSLKDTALFSMLKAGVDDLSVMQAAGHKDLSMTTIYANHHDNELITNLNKKAPKFGQKVTTQKQDRNRPLKVVTYRTRKRSL